jgi:hypothetical protein
MTASDDNGLSRKELVTNVFFDLLSLRVNESVLAELFRAPRGGWRSVAGLSGGALRTTLACPDRLDSMFMAWLDLPIADEKGFAVVVFQAYFEDEQWGTTAIYNRARLIQAHGTEQS